MDNKILFFILAVILFLIGYTIRNLKKFLYTKDDITDIDTAINYFNKENKS